MRPIKMHKGLIILWMIVLMVTALPANAMVNSCQLGYNTNTSDNGYISTTKAPRERIRKSMFIPFRVRAMDEDINNLKINLQQTNDFQQIEERGNGDYTVDYYPSEIMEITFLTKSVGNTKKGNIKGVSLSTNARQDAQQGYYSILVCLEWDGGSNTNYINVWISTGTSSDVDGEEDTKEGNHFVVGENQLIPQGIYPNIMDYTVSFHNKCNTTVQDVTVNMQLSEGNTKFPFEINDGNYDRTFERVQSGETVSASYSMAVCKDPYSRYYPIKYIITLRLSSEGNLHKEGGTFYAHIISEDKEDDLRDFDANDRTKARLAVGSYYTVPKQIFTGDEFELVLNMKNASVPVPASDILFSLESEKVPDSAVFTTGSGSLSMVVDDLDAGQSTEVRAKFMARAGMDQRPYVITIKEKYDSPESKDAEESITVDIPVKQYAKLSTSAIDVMPDSMAVGSESDVMFGTNNTGKVILYNMTVISESDPIETTDAYTGNIGSGETGNMDAMFTGINPIVDDGAVEISISYEDEDGVAVDSVVRELTLFIAEEVDEFFDMSTDMETRVMDVQTSPSFWSKHKALIIAGTAAAAGAGTTAAVAIRKERRTAKEEDVDDEIS